jgi:hypothetical protein
VQLQGESSHTSLSDTGNNSLSEKKKQFSDNYIKRTYGFPVSHNTLPAVIPSFRISVYLGLLRDCGKIITVKGELTIVRIPLYFTASRQNELAGSLASQYTRSQVFPEGYVPSYPGFRINYSRIRRRDRHHEGSATFS